MTATSPVVLIWLFGSIVAVFLTIGVAVPAFLILRKAGWLAWWQILPAGIASAIPFMVAIYWPFDKPIAAYVVMEETVLTVGIAATTSLIFWYAAVWRNAALTSVRAGAQKAARGST